MLLRECHEGRLEGGLSLSLKATPDEVIGPLTWAMGGAAKTLRVLDVRSGPPMVLEVEWNSHQAQWEVDSIEALIAELNRAFDGAPGVKALHVLGEYEGAIQVQAVPAQE